MLWGHPSAPCQCAHTHTQQILAKSPIHKVKGTQKLIVWPRVKCHFCGRDCSLCGVVQPLQSPSCPRQKPNQRERTYLVISKLQPFRRSKALFRMMPLSLPRYTFLSEFMGAGRAGRLGETAALSFQEKKKVKKSSSGLLRGGRRNGLSEKEEEEKKKSSDARSTSAERGK